MVSPLDIWNFYAHYIDPVDFSSMHKCSHLPRYLSYFCVDRRACNLAYSFILTFSTVSLTCSSRCVDLRVDQFILHRHYYFVALVF